ncbi:MAG: thioredoxin fold domain-containing protein [Candidatus Sedimenticola sp. (ex Thyasira tokunagai)]
MKPALSRLIFLLLTLLLSIPLMAQAADNEEESSFPEVTVVEASDMVADGITAGHEKKVLMVLVSQEFCPFCEDIKRDVIRPMIRGEDFKGQLMIRELSIDPGVEVRDFSGTKRSGMNLAADYNADFTPTLLFLSPDGRELHKSIVGYTTPDLFYYYVEESIKGAILALKKWSK